jgi:hypothetical protein
MGRSISLKRIVNEYPLVANKQMKILIWGVSTPNSCLEVRNISFFSISPHLYSAI